MLVAILKFQEGGPTELSAAFKVVMSLEESGTFHLQRIQKFLSGIGTANRTSFIHGHT